MRPDSRSKLDKGSYDALSLRGGFGSCMTCLTSGWPAPAKELSLRLAAADGVSSAELDDDYTFNFFDVECAYVPRSDGGPWDGTASCNAIVQIAAVTAGAGNGSRQGQRFNVYVKTPTGKRAAKNMKAAPEEADVDDADKLSPAAALQKFVAWALEQHQQHAGEGADPSRLILVSHYSFGYAFSILLQHAEKHKVQLPAVQVADSCLWVKTARSSPTARV
ncbi:hypothetical protein OEZ85_012448 [Tetradesmus obliquus]|uniref:Uncharacterized protein n=1 Tax=Tetradesmus obliquus TaxID=3088 RepID=A0ABY8TTD2_TETOB|nr:hypothetical protein OEZ85_012448 [Tetradesmus obliquus]